MGSTAHFFLLFRFWRSTQLSATKRESGRDTGAHGAPPGLRAGRLGPVAEERIGARLHRQAARGRCRGLRQSVDSPHAPVRRGEYFVRTPGSLLPGPRPRAQESGGFRSLRGRGSEADAAREHRQCQANEGRAARLGRRRGCRGNRNGQTRNSPCQHRQGAAGGEERVGKHKMKKRASGTEEKVAKVAKVAKVNAKTSAPAPDLKAEKQRMNRELLLLVDALAREKNVPKDIVFT